MKTITRFSVIALAVSVTCALVAGPKDDVAAAIKKLKDAPNYTWKSSWENSQFNAGPTIGKINKAGLAVMSRTFGDNTTLSVHQGEKAASQTQDGWRSLAELEQDTEGRGRWSAMMLRNFTSAAQDAEELLKSCKELAVKDGVCSGTLTEEGAKTMLSFRRRGGGADGGPEISNASGSVKFWVEGGNLKKYQYSVAGTMSWNGNDRDMDRTMTVEISDVGTTTVEIPEGAKSKL